MRWRVAVLLLAALCAPCADTRQLHATFYTANAPQGTLEAALETPLSTLGNARLVEDSHEGNSPVSSREFRATAYGITAVLAIDTSGSVQGTPLQAVKAALKDFVSSSRAQDRIAVISFADTITVRQPFTADKAQLTRAIDALRVEGRQTLLNGAIAKSLSLLATESLNARKHLLVITDGKNEGAGPSVAELTETALKTGIPVDCIGVTRLTGKYLAPMQALALASGGVYLRTRGYEHLSEAMREGINGLLGSPVLTFRLAKLAADGQTHSLRISLAGVSSNAASVLFPMAPKSDTSLYVSIAAAMLLFGLGMMLIYRGRKSALQPAENLPVRATNPTVPAAPSVKNAQPRAARVATVYERKDSGPAHSGAASAAARAPIVPARVDARPPVPLPDSGSPSTARPTEFRQTFSPPAVGRPAAWFRLVSQPGATTPIPAPKFPIDAVEVWIGAGEANQICVAHDTAVSRVHACIHWSSGDLFLMDNHATNGTIVNGRPIQPGVRVRLRVGDQIVLGLSVFSIDSAE